MSSREHHVTAPEDRIPLRQKSAYAVGMLVNNLQAAALPAMVVILNLGLGMNPLLVGWISAIPRAFDAISDPMVGYISDNTRTRWGRRRPFIFVGAILAGLVFALMWQLPDGQSEIFYFCVFLAASIIFFLTYTLFATPFVAFGYEMTADYHERTRLHAFANTTGQLVWLGVPWFYWIMANERLFRDTVHGARTLAIGVGLTVALLGIVPAIVCRERALPDVTATRGEGLFANTVKFLRGIRTTFRCRPFVKICSATFLIFNGYQLGFSFSLYVMIYYVFGGDDSSTSELLGGFGKITVALALTFIVVTSWLATRIADLKKFLATISGSFIGLYVMLYYVFGVFGGRDSSAGELLGWFGTITAVATLVVITLTSRLATHIGKRRTFYITISVSLVGYALKWVGYNPEQPHWLLYTAPLIAFGVGSLFTLMGSMIADVCDFDELNTAKRREGVFGAIYWWMVKIGMALAGLLTGIMLNVSGFDVALEVQTERTQFLLKFFDVGVPLITSALAIVIMLGYELSEGKAYEIREELERRRGKLGSDPAAA